MASIIPGGGKVVLPLVALGGIALWINYYYYRRKRSRSQEEIFEVDDETKEDYLSQLPDDVLYSILGNLTLRDAARTSILSTSWKYLFPSMQQLQHTQCWNPTLDASKPSFRCLSMFGIDIFSHSCCPYYQEKVKFMNGIYQFVKHNFGRRVALIELVCCFAREFPSGFSQWCRSLSRLRVEKLHLSFQCFAIYPIRDSRKLFKFSIETLSQAPSLKFLFLSDCIVISSYKIYRFNSLVTLALRGVVLTSGHLEGILSSCSKLKMLFIYNSKLPYKLRLIGTVTNVVIVNCDGGEEIDLHAAYLCTLECKINNNVRFFFTFVPKLEKIMVCHYWKCPSNSYIFGWQRPSNSYIFGDRARDLPDQVKSLTLKLFPEKEKSFPVEIPIEMKTFRNLRKLTLILVTSYNILEIFELSRLLGACPLLHDLTFVVRNINRVQDVRGSRRPPLSPTRHTELKQVTYDGFYGSGAEMEFVLYILKSATVLDRMFLSPRIKNYFNSAWATDLNVSFNERQRNSIQQKVRGKAVSKKAVVIIQ